MLTHECKMRAGSVKLPFFSFSRHILDAPVPVECPGAAGYALAFTSLIDASSYLRADKRSELDVTLINRQSLARYLDDLEQAGLVGIGFDPQSGRVPTIVSLAELRRMFAT